VSHNFSTSPQLRGFKRKVKPNNNSSQIYNYKFKKPIDGKVKILLISVDGQTKFTREKHDEGSYLSLIHIL
jgi:hypothetical protein